DRLSQLSQRWQKSWLNPVSVLSAGLRGLVAPAFPVFIRPMSLPYQVATLLYCFNREDEVLLLERAQEPNLGFWSPCGGKLHQQQGESPYACACREAQEELGLNLAVSD